MEKKIVMQSAAGIEFNVVLGHTREEVAAWQNDDLWDFLLEEVLDDTIEASATMLYWLIDGRLYETPWSVDDYHTPSPIKNAYDDLYAAFDELYEKIKEAVVNNGGFVNLANDDNKRDRIYGFVTNPRLNYALEDDASENQVVAIAVVSNELMVRFDFDDVYNPADLADEVRELHGDVSEMFYFDQWFTLDGADYCWKLQTLANIAEFIEEYI